MKFTVITGSLDHWNMGLEYKSEIYGDQPSMLWLQFVFFEIGIYFKDNKGGW